MSAPRDELREAAKRLSDAISDKAAARGWAAEMSADTEYLTALKALRAALARPKSDIR